MAAAAVEDIVGRVVHQQGAHALGLDGQQSRRSGVDLAGQFGFALGLVDGGMGRGIDDDLGGDGAHLGQQGFRLGEVGAVVVVHRHHFAGHGERALQFPADLAAFAEEEDFHADVYCLDTQSL